MQSGPLDHITHARIPDDSVSMCFRVTDAESLMVFLTEPFSCCRLQIRAALAGVCNTIRMHTAEREEVSSTLGDVVIALRTTMPAAGSDEATLVVIVAAGSFIAASSAMTQAVNLIKGIDL